MTPQDTAPPHATPHDRSAKELIGALLGEIGRLVRLELRMAQAETSEKISRAQNGLIMIVVGFLLAFCALLILLQALVIGLSTFMPAWAAAIVVAVIVAGVAFALVRHGESTLKLGSLMPEKTLRSLQRDKDLVMEKAR